ncbi:MAG: aminopeptidase P family protein [Actinobacteria bacterium]|nr:aminopeptidase P family protein [Actinomycetota bacterium]
MLTSATMEARTDTISVEERRRRRRTLLETLDGAVAVVFAGAETGSASLQGRWKTDRLFWYLTGLDHESGGAVVFDPTAEDPDRRISLYLRPRDPESERWYGAREPLDSDLKAKTGFDSILRTPLLPSRLTEAARRAKRVACLHPFAPYNAAISPDLEVFKRIADHVPGVAIEDRTQLLPRMRAVKSPAEVALIKKAVAATAAGFENALRFIQPGVTERQIAEALTAGFRTLGGEPAFAPIVGAGANGAVLHYEDLDQTVKDGELIVIDYAASYAGYASDVTRTLPASGIFTPEQRELYQIVLDANLAAMKAVRPGATMSEIHNAALEIISEAGHKDDFIHGIGHQLGIEVHDVMPDGPLVAGMVLTIEPGIYLPERGVGIRIEDDVLVTDTGCVDLTAAIPKRVKDIEAAMAIR